MEASAAAEEAEAEEEEEEEEEEEDRRGRCCACSLFFECFARRAFLLLPLLRLRAVSGCAWRTDTDLARMAR